MRVQRKRAKRAMQRRHAVTVEAIKGNNMTSSTRGEDMHISILSTKNAFPIYVCG